MGNKHFFLFFYVILSSIKNLLHNLYSRCLKLLYLEKKERKHFLSGLMNNLILNKNEFIFHAGTKSSLKKIYSDGGRVLNFVVLSDDFKISRKKAIELIKNLDWKNGFYRKDIGFKVIDK